jgi:hypothetical protein
MTVTELLDKIDDFDKLTDKEQVKLLSYFHITAHGKEYFTTTDIKEEFDAQKLRQPSNVSSELSNLGRMKPPIVLKDKKGWTFHRTAKKDLDEIHLGTSHKRAISITLRGLLKIVTGKEQQLFLEEAIICFEVKAFRASIIMTWLLCLDVLYEYILQNKLTEFNASIQAHGKYKKIQIAKKDDFTDIKESDFIELCRVAKIITGDVRKILDEKLDFRNTCAHPNTIVVNEPKVIAYIDDLVTNVITKYQ